MKFKKKHIIISCSFLLVAISWLTIRTFLPEGKIYLDHRETQQFHIATVKAKDLRYAFFGTAFHLHYDNNQLEFDHYTLGDYFTSQDSPILLADDKEGTLIVGITLKRGELIKKEEGALLNFYFKKQPAYEFVPDFHFTNTVFSTFDNSRKDIQNVFFTNT